MLSVLILLLSTLGPPEPTIDLTLEHVLDEPSPVWEVTLVARGLSPETPPTLRLEDWGEWTERPGYVTLLESDPPLAGEGPNWTIADESAFAGELSVRYRLALSDFGSPEHRRHGLLPVRSETYTFGYSWNVLPSLEGDDGAVPATRRLRLVAPEGVPIVTGWAGRADGSSAEVELEREQGNALIAFGTPRASALGDGVQVYQFGGSVDAAGPVHELVAALVPSMAAACAHPAPEPLIVLITDTHGGGTGTDHGLRIGFTRDADEERTRDPYFRSLVSHELFHQWLGSTLSMRDSSVVWFQEGFTDYLSLWHLAVTGGIDRAWFVERLSDLDHEARTSSSLGRVAFADPDVRWRDGDGPNETMAYKGGAVLALAIDAELRARGRTGLHELLRDLIEQGPEYDRESIRSWLRDQGLEELDARAVAGLDVPTVRASLERAGIRLEERETLLTYTGLRTGGEPFGTVLDVAEDSPAKTAGIQTGDVIGGFCHVRSARPAIGPGVDVEHRFGLVWFDPERDDHRIWVARDGEELELEIRPEAIPGGLLHRWVLEGETGDAFFLPVR